AAEPSAAATTAAQAAEPARTAAQAAEPTRTAVPLAKPPVRKLAKELGIDLNALTGSGPNGVITRDDVRLGGTPADNGTDSGTANGATAASAPASAGTGTGTGTAGERRVPIKGVRKATASAMVSSAFTAPHVTEFLAVDVTPMIELRDRLRASAAFRDVKLSPLTFAAKAVCLAARRTPEVNASWDDAAQEIVYYDHVQLGIAAATPRGLVVPKIRDADTMSLRGLAEALGELTVTARAGKTSPAEMLGGTFTITNVGVFGVDTGTPILNPGESAILALGAVKQAPWVVDGQLAVRTVCQLALSFDHRVVDGEQGSRFLADVGALLADPGLALTY
ncbi:MAG TPA: dihydrolipoamide acetyltransferase family protein, partial [Pseudonocardia sp.]|nr:dihydrolipoamide acetyltransferase family protein [Pseudonocardia sp.]